MRGASLIVVRLALLPLAWLGVRLAHASARARPQLQELTERYRERLHGVSGISIPFGELEEGNVSSHHLAVALLPDGRRDEVRATLADRRIQTSVHYPPIHLFSYYAELGARRPLPRTEAAAERVVTLPLYGHMTDEQADLVIEALLETVGAGA